MAGLPTASSPKDSEQSRAPLLGNRGLLLLLWDLPQPPSGSAVQSQRPRQVAKGGRKGLLEPKTLRLSHKSEQTGGGVEGELRGHEC